MIYKLMLCFGIFFAVNAETGSPCNGTNQCTGDNYECSDDGFCRCLKGYRLNKTPTSETCGENCTDNGNGYTVYTKYFAPPTTIIYPASGEYYSIVASLCECTALCSNTTGCIMGTYIGPQQRCYLFSTISTSQSRWDGYLIGGSTDYAFVRHCSNNIACGPGRVKQTFNDILQLPGNCTSCLSGSLISETNAEICARCTPCKPGYQANENQTSCEACEGNTASPVAGGNCTACASNQVATANNTQCEACPPGTIPSDTSICIPCPSGTEANNEQSACTACLDNTVSETDGGTCTNCSAGYQANLDHTACMAIEKLSFNSSDQKGNKDSNSKANNAIDNDNSTCAKTAQRRNPYWVGKLSNPAVVTEVFIKNVGAGGNLDITVFIENHEDDRMNPCNNYVGPSADVRFSCLPNLSGRYVIVQRYPRNNKKRILRACEVIVRGYYLQD